MVHRGKYILCFYVICLVSVVFSSNISAQVQVSGKVLDQRTRKPVPFAALVEHGVQNGTSTDLDGKFSLVVNSVPVQLDISCIGYDQSSLNINGGNIKGLQIVLTPVSYELNEVMIKPKENPALAIIRKVMEHRDSLNPNNLNSYSYDTYNKTIFTGRKSDKVNPLESMFGTNDTLNRAVETIFNRQHLFINESVTEKKYLKPGNFKEVITASRTSGMKDPIFSTLTTQLQSLSFYENQDFKILSTTYKNPLTNGALSYYYYEIVDTTFSGSDSVFVIAFRPKGGWKFKGLKGMLHINTTYYALEQVSATPASKDQLQLDITQVYERFDDGHWFPVQLNTDMLMNRLKIGKYKIAVEARTYIKNVKINPKFRRREFGAIEVDVDPNAVKNKDTVLARYRQNDLSKKDSLTYLTIDSLADQLKLEKRLDFIEAALDGKIRVWVFDFPVDKVLNFNNYEGFRLGLGIETNHRMLKWMNVGGYFAYGFTDKAIKYGGFIEFIPHQQTDFRIRFDYKRDVFSSGLHDFPVKGPVMIENLTSQIVLNTFDSIQVFEGSISISPVKNLRLRLAMNHQQMDPTLQYRYLPDSTLNQSFNFTEVDLSGRWGIREKYIAVGRRYIAKPTKFPIIHFRVTQSLPGLGGEFSYTRLMSRVDQTFYIPRVGKTKLSVEGGYVIGDAPYSKLFANRGTFSGFSIVSRNGFETMRANEFIMDSYVSVFFSHNFGTLFKVKKFIRPELVIVHNFGFGWLRDPSRHDGVSFRSMRHGFFEGGLVLDNILVLANLGMGVGVFHRYGSTANGDPLQNFYFKMAISTAF